LLLCACLTLSQTASAFLCFLSGAGNRSYSRPAPYRGPSYTTAAHRLPPIMPRKPRPAKRAAPPRRPPPPLRWRPIDYRTGSR